MEENTNNKYVEFDTIVKEVTRELSSSVLIHPAKETSESMYIHCVYGRVLDIFATININMPNEKLMDMMYDLKTLWARLFVNDCFECDNKQSITSCIDRMFDIAQDKVNDTSDQQLLTDDDDKRFYEAISAVLEELSKLDNPSGDDNAYTKICNIIEYITTSNHYPSDRTLRYKMYLLGSIGDIMIAAEKSGFLEYNRKLVISMIQTMFDQTFNHKSNNEEDK